MTGDLFPDVEEVARGIHDSAEVAVRAGAILAKPTFPWKSYDEIPENVREGRRMQARWFLARFSVTRRA